MLVPNLFTVEMGTKRCYHVSSQGKAESSELVSPKTTDDIVPEKGAEEGRAVRRRHKTESVKQQWSQERAGAVELEQLQRCVPPPSQQLALTVSVLIFFVLSPWSNLKPHISLTNPVYISCYICILYMSMLSCTCVTSPTYFTLSYDELPPTISLEII